ncbi:MAG: hypothetical protein ACE5HT_14815 [Gemmatimonadales bacterium]
MAAENSPKVGTAYFRLRAHLGLAKSFWALQMRRESAREAAAAQGLMESLEGSGFEWVWEGAPGHAYYDFAIYHATLGRLDESLKSLRQAVDAGWADAPQLHAEPAFAALAGVPDFDRLVTTLETRQRLPRANLPGET